MLDAVRRQLIMFDLMSKKLLFYSLDGVCEKVVPRFGVFEDRYIRDSGYCSWIDCNDYC